MKPVKVLIVEDDESSAYLLKRHLVKAGYEVIGPAVTGEEAINSLTEHNPAIIIMDIGLEGSMDGVDTANSIQQSHQVPIIFLTAFYDRETIERAMEIAPLAYILKPFTQKELIITIEMALHKHRLEQKLKDSELRLTTVLDNVPGGFISTNPQGRITYMNPAAELFTGTAGATDGSRFIGEILDIRDALTEEIFTDMETCFKEGVFTEINGRDFLMTSASGERRFVQIQFTPAPDAQSNHNGYVVFIRDMSKQYQAELSRKIMGEAMESLEEAILITDACFEGDGPRIEYANKGFEELTGYCRKKVVGQTLDLQYGDKTDADFNARMLAGLRESHRFTGETYIHDKQGQEHLTQWNVASVCSERGEILKLVYAIRDITRIRSYEENIRQSQKIEAIGRLAGGIAHDFNNLLSVINSYTDLLKLKIEESSPLASYVQQISSAGLRGADLVSKLMTFSRREDSNPTALDPAEVIREFKNILERLIPENIEVQITFGEKVESILAEQGQLEQMLINLCLNARDAISGNGKISIDIDKVDINQAQAMVGDHIKPGNYIRISVEDNGCGMEEKTLSRIFEPFYTTKDVGEGTGLGLSSTYGILKQLGAYITVTSTPGKGTRFDMYFQSVQQEAASHRPEEPREQQFTGTETILVVEDDENLADCITGLLSLHGYNAHSACNGLEALEFFGDKAEDIKVLITDLVLPGISGKEVAERMREKNPHLKIIFMSGYDEKLQALETDSDGYLFLQKPFSINRVLSKVRQLLDIPETADRLIRG